MSESEWILCPICGSKTRDKIRVDTEMKNFPVFCPKCKEETLIDVKQFQITVVEEWYYVKKKYKLKEPAAKPQS